MATQLAEADTQAPKREKKDVHWIVTELFDLAAKAFPDERQIDKMLEAKIQEVTGVRIPHNTLRYWRNRWSEPKISEVDLIAQALGHELDLMSKES